MEKHKLATLHYSFALLIIAFYGTQVCPFLESLTTIQLVTPLLVGFACQWLLRIWIINTLVQSQTIEKRVSRQFTVDMALFAATGLFIGIFNTWQYQFPLESGGKVVVGMLVLGFLTACDLALDLERRTAMDLAKKGEHLPLGSSMHPIGRRFAVFASLCAMSVIAVLFLVISKDLEWLIHTGDNIPLETSRRYILTELVFVMGVISAYVLRVIFSYAATLGLFLDHENRALHAVAAGDLDVQVPVTSNTEFGQIAANTNYTIEQLAQRTAELNLTRDASILSLASLAETRDNETGNHILRTQRYVRVLAQTLQDHPRFADSLDKDTIELLFKSAPLHDIGKVGIPDAILLKPGKLTDEEFAIMKQHPQIGAEALLKAESMLGSNSFLQLAREISESHHEKWDGSGYPKRLKGADIPVSGRLMALADVYDALISKRVYKPAFSHEKARGIILEGKGSHFDPDIVDAFLRCEKDFQDIAREYAEQEDQSDAA